MPKTMLVNVTHPEESRIAILNDGVLDSYEIETTNRTHIKGNIYNAVVESVHASLAAAFVFLGPNLKGFLPIDEVNFKLLPAVGEKGGKGGRIGQHLRPGQKLMVQVTREPFAGKPPTVSTYFSLPGRSLVLMPGVDSAGVSRRIEDAEQRNLLKQWIEELQPPEGFGVIVRTAGFGQTKTELQRDLRYLLRLWESIGKASPGAGFPGLVYQERDLVIRTVRDHFAPDIKEIWIDQAEAFERAHEFMKKVMPQKARSLKLYEGDRPLFNKFNLEEQIETIYQRKVRLPAGGEIVIDGTEALTAIDVNTARAKKRKDVEEFVTETNLQAAVEIARQLRLRDLGGLIVIDFIDMMQMKNRKKVEKTVRDALKSDRAKSDITTISKLGLMEIARQRIRGAKLGASYATCPTCDGHGLIRNIESAALAALRKLQTRAAQGKPGRLQLDLPGEVAVWLLNQKRDELQQIESHHQVRIVVNPDEKLLRHESGFQFEAGAPPVPVQVQAPAAAAAAAPEPVTPEEPQRIITVPGKQASDTTEAEKDAPAETPRKSTRRGRRGGRRRSRNTSSEATDTPQEPKPKAPEARPKAAAPVVPATIRSDELMPAAAPRGNNRGRGRGRGGRS
jgi:ribonuclease E